MKKVLLAIVSLAVIGSSFAQTDVQKKLENRVQKVETETKKLDNTTKNHEDRIQKIEKKLRAVPYGFVRNYFNYDSRNTYTVIGGEYNMIPYDEKWNVSEQFAEQYGVERTDQNDVATAHLLAITTRLGFNIEGPDVLGAKTTGKMEADFGGFSTTNSVLRIRHAYVKMNWQDTTNNLNHELLCGQTWHPLSGDIMPEVLGMAAGAPFRAHSRTPQLRYILYHGNIGLTAAALYQLQYMYNGPSLSNGSWTSTASTSYANTAIMPELFLGFQYKDKNIYTQLGSTFQSMRPRTYGVKTVTLEDGTTKNVNVKVDEMLHSFTPTFYFQYTGSKWAAKFRTMLASNTSHVNQINGYGVTAVNEDGSWSYAPIKAAISYLNFSYGKKYRANLFLGHMQNLGAGEELHNFGTAADPNYRVYMKGGSNFTGLSSIYRVAPSISYNLPHFNVGLEYEWTACQYGQQDVDGSILNNDALHTVANNRICVLVKYNF